jgi:hypothetical protein
LIYKGYIRNDLVMSSDQPCDAQTPKPLSYLRPGLRIRLRHGPAWVSRSGLSESNTLQPPGKIQPLGHDFQKKFAGQNRQAANLHHRF